MKTSPIILELPLFVVGLATVVTIVSFRNKYPLALRKLSLLWVLNFLVDLAGHITRYYHIKNHWLYNCYFFIQFLVLAYLYDGQISNPFIHRCIRLFYVFFPLLVLTESIIYGILDLQVISYVCGGVFMIFLAAGYFRQLYLSEETGSITRDPWFWFSCGFFVHFGVTMPFFGMLNYFNAHYPGFAGKYYFYVSNPSTMVLNLLIIAGYLCRGINKKSH